MAAMKELGWKSFHDAQQANKILEGNGGSLFHVVESLRDRGFNAFADWPFLRDIPSLVNAYPDAKFVYTVRPFADWLRSVASHPVKIMQAEQFTLATLRKRYDDHHAMCMRLIREKNGIVLRTGEGWGGLPAYLGEPTPDTDYPHQTEGIRPWPAGVDPVSPYQFSSDWVSRHHDVWLGLCKDLVGKQCRILELGTYEGRSTLWFLDNVATHGKSRVVTVDKLHQFPRRKKLFHNLSMHPQSFKVRFLEGMTHRTVPIFPDEHFDLAYLDASHEARDTLNDAGNVWRKLKVGGILIFDDYLWVPGEGHNRDLPPKPGIDVFLTLYASKLEILHHGYQLAVRRKG